METYTELKVEWNYSNNYLHILQEELIRSGLNYEEWNQEVKPLKNVKKVVDDTKKSIEKTIELTKNLKDEDFPKIVLNKTLAQPKLFVAEYYVDPERAWCGNLEFIKVSVAGDGYSKTYKYEEFHKNYTTYSEKYVRLHYPDYD